MIKIQPVLGLLCVLFSVQLLGQVLVSKEASDTAHPSAQLEVRSGAKGFLPPVMSTSMRRAIQNPAEGLMVFDSSKQKMYVFTKAGWQAFNHIQESLVISEGSAFSNPGFSPNELAGHKVEVNGNYAYIGAWGSNINGKVEQGSVYMYKFENGTWNYITKIIAPDGQAGDFFGSDISATESFVFISASGDSFGENLKQGSVYIYKWVDNSLNYQTKITGSNATAGDRFGFDIEAKGNLLVVGATMDDIGENVNQGSVYFFELEGNNWVEKHKYFATVNVASNNLLGKGIFIDANFVVVGCDFLNSSGIFGFNRNRISIFQRSVEGEWGLHSEIINPTGQNFESFGYSVTLKDDILTVSAIFRDIPIGNKDRGAVYVYKRNGMLWNAIQTIAPIDSSIADLFGDYFGHHIDRDGKYLLVGSTFEDFGSGQNDYGGAFVYEWDGNQFVQIKKLSSASPQIQELFGYGVAIHNGHIVVGAPGRNSNSGGAYFFFLE
jgi:hypothetical protein